MFDSKSGGFHAATKQYLFRPVFGRFCLKSVAVRPPNFPGKSFFLFGRFCVISQNFRPAGNSDDNKYGMPFDQGKVTQIERVHDDHEEQGEESV
jgi:hypothetical protein